MYEGIHAYPDGDSTLSRMAKTAGEYGYDGVVVRNHSGMNADYDPEEIIQQYGVDVVDGVEIRAEDPQQASGSVGNLRTSSTVVVIHGGTTELNRFAAENEKVDVLAHPMAATGDINHVIAKAAAENGVRLEVSLEDVVQATGGFRVRAIQALRKLRELIEYYDVPYVVSVDSSSHLELRSPRELCALGEEIGFSTEQIEAGLREWRFIAERNRQVRSDSFIEPGVKERSYETER